MGFFDFFKKSTSPSVHVISISNADNSGEEEYWETRKRREEPQLLVMDVRQSFYSYQGEKFDFKNTIVARYQGCNGKHVDYYLLGGENQQRFKADMLELDSLLLNANSIVNIPSFCFPVKDIIWEPTYIIQPHDRRWEETRIFPQPLTKTGKFPKYPILVRISSRDGKYTAEVKYTQNDTLETGTIHLWGNPDSFSLYFNGKAIKRIMRHRGAENFPIYTE